MRRAFTCSWLLLAISACTEAREAPCRLETAAALCTAAGATCGEVDATDACGEARHVTCGAGCAVGEACVDHTCVCRPETYAALCESARAECGTITATDRCGATRTVTCAANCPPDHTCVANRCACVEQSDAELCAAARLECGQATVVDACGRAREVTCADTCTTDQVCAETLCACAHDPAAVCAGIGAECGRVVTPVCGREIPVQCGTCPTDQVCSPGSACVCGTAGYVGDSVTDLDAAGRRDPATDSLLNDVPWIDDGGTWRGCTQNTTPALAAGCVSIGGHQSHLLGASADGGVLLVDRAAGACGLGELWLYEGTLEPQSYAGRELTGTLRAAGFDSAEGQRITLSHDGLTILGRTPAGRLQAISRPALGSATWSAPSELWFTEVNARAPIDQVALSADGLFLFLTVPSAAAVHWEARRATATEPFGAPAPLPGTAPGQVNGGGYGVISGAAAGGRTIYATATFDTVVLARDHLDLPFAPLDAAVHLPIWYAHPVRGCHLLLGTLSPGGCANEGIGALGLGD